MLTGSHISKSKTTENKLRPQTPAQDKHQSCLFVENSTVSGKTKSTKQD